MSEQKTLLEVLAGHGVDEAVAARTRYALRATLGEFGAELAERLAESAEVAPLSDGELERAALEISTEREAWAGRVSTLEAEKVELEAELAVARAASHAAGEKLSLLNADEWKRVFGEAKPE